MSQLPFDIPPIPPLPDYMAGINQAYADNQAQRQPEKKKFDFGKFLLGWAGHLGDNLAGNTVYADTMRKHAEAQAEARAEEERRRYEQDWWFQQQKYKAENEKQAPSEFQRVLIESGIQPGSEAWVKAHERKRQLTLDPIVQTTTHGPVPYSHITGSLQPPTQPVGKLTPIEGDASGNAGGGFPDPLAPLWW